MKKYLGKLRLRTLISLGLIIIVLPIVAFALFRPSGTEAKWHEPAWSYRKKLTINPSQVSGSGVHEDFPVLVSLSSDTDLSAGAQTDGDDIIFVDADSNRLDHEIESYATGTLVAWVRIPELSTSEYTDIYMYYGNAAVASQENAAGVWPDYITVHHLEETTTGATDILDSTSNAIDSQSVTVDGAGSNIDATGKIGSAVQFDGSNDEILFDDSALFNFDDFTVSAWINLDTIPGAGVDPTWFMLDHNASPWYSSFFRIRGQGGGLAEVYGSIYNSAGTLEKNFNSQDDIDTTAVWYHVAVSRSGDDVVTYINGVDRTQFVDTDSVGTLLDAVRPTIGSGYGEKYLDGTMDEFKVASVKKTTDWIATEYNNQNSPSTFFSTSAEEQNSDSGPMIHWKFDEGVDNTCAGGTNDYCDSVGSADGNVYSGTPERRPESDCINGGCIRIYDTSTEMLEMSNHNFPTGDFTVTGWFKKTGSTEDETFFILSDGSGGSEVELRWRFGQTIQIVVDGTTSETTETFEKNKWYHFSLTRSGTSVTLYMNGNVVDTLTDGTVLSYGSCNIYIGADIDSGCNGTLGEYFDGFVDDYKIYSYARSADQVKQDYIARGSTGGVAAQFGPDNKSFLSDGLVGYWPMDDDVSGNAQTITDTSGSGINGSTNYGANTTGMNCTLAGKFGYGCDLDGTDDYISVASPNLPTGDFTYSMWINLDATSDEVLINALNGSGVDQIAIGVASNKLFGRINGTTIFSGVATLSIDTWYHIAVTRKGSEFTGYINGVYDDSDPDGTTLNFSTCPLLIGVDADNTCTGSLGNYTDGTIEEVRIYNRALSPKEVEKLYNWAPGPIAYFNFDEGSNIDTIYDRSGTGANAIAEAVNSPNASFVEDDFRPGKYGGSVYFDGVDHKYNFYSADLDSKFVGSAGSIMAWVRVLDESQWSGDEGAVMYVSANSSNAVRFGQSASANSWGFRVDLGGTTNSTQINSGSDTKWHHLAVVWDDRDDTDTLYYYIDGVVAGTASNAGNWTGALDSARVNIGARIGSSQDPFKGLIDEVKVYNYPRSTSQIVQDMNGGHPIGGSPVGSQAAYWKFDEGYGDTANDTLGVNTGDLAGSGTTCPTTGACPTWTTSGKFDNALDFDGSDDYVIGGSDTSIDDIFDGGGTVTAWINADTFGAAGFGRIVDKDTDGTASGWGFGVCDDNGVTYCDNALMFWNTTDANAGIWVTSTNSFSTGSWTHVAISYDTDSLSTAPKIYINGKLATVSVHQAPTGNDTSDAPDNLYIGNRENGDLAFDGKIDDLKIYSSVLTQDQLLIDMNANANANFGTGTDESAQVLGTTLPAPVSYWNLDENSGTTTVYDKSGNGHDGTLTGAMTEDDWVPGKYGSALDFDGTDDEVTISVTGTNPYSSNTFSVSAWIYKTSDSEGNEVIFSNEEADNDGFRLLVSASGNDDLMCTYNSTDASNTTDFLIPLNTWTHVLCTSSGTELKTYVNGQLTEPANAITGDILVADNSDASIGGTAYNSTGDFPGYIDEVKVWDVALTEAQIAYEYNRGKPIAHWKFDECQGSTVYDTSGNDKNGTITPGASGNTAAGTCGSGTTTEMWDDGTTGKLNTSLGFDGTDDYVSVTSPNLPTGDFTYSLWFYHTNDSSDYLFSSLNTVASNEISIRVLAAASGGDVRVDLDGSTSRCDGSAITSLNTWYHYAVTRSGSTITGYLNGAPDCTGTDGDVLAFDSACPLIIGADDDRTSNCSTGTIGSYWEGKLDDFRIYNYALTQDQIKLIMLGGDAGSAARFGD